LKRILASFWQRGNSGRIRAGLGCIPEQWGKSENAQAVWSWAGHPGKLKKSE